MGSKITIIGAGNVGSTIAYTLSNSNLASEIVLIDINDKKVKGEVMDIAQGVSFRDPISIVAGEYEDAKDSDIVIITSGVGRQPGQTRLELTQTNVNILKKITPEIVKYAPNALYIIVSNPVDIMTYVFTKISGLPENRIIGSGTLLDTSRLRYALSEHFKVAQRNIHTYVFGEHGDSSFVPWSIARVSGAGIDDYTRMIKKYHSDIKEINKEEIVEYIHTSGGEIIADKGATYYAVSVAVCRLCSILLSAYDSIVTVSTMLHGEYGLSDVCLSIPNIIGPDGAKGKVEVTLTDEEVNKLKHSADVLKDIIKDLKI
jgi:L-lactate dehydrogenase